jgi:hypothetical protein
MEVDTLAKRRYLGSAGAASTLGLPWQTLESKIWKLRRLEVANLDKFEGSSVYYWASPLEERLCGGQELVLVGGGNSAGHAVVYLASTAKKVWLLARRPLTETMSRYLIDRVVKLRSFATARKAAMALRFVPAIYEFAS